MMRISRRGLFRRAAVVAAAAPLGLVGVAQSVEQQPPNLPDAGSNPVAPAKLGGVLEFVRTANPEYPTSPWDTPFLSRGGWGHEWVEPDLWQDDGFGGPRCPSCGVKKHDGTLCAECVKRMWP